LLKWLLTHDASINKLLVFTATKALADELYEELLADYEDQMGVIHSNKAQNHRFNTVEQFKNGTYRFIIATDIVARGIDVESVSHVINFDLPEVPENYIHRIGRTGRADKAGIAISFIRPKDWDAQVAIETLMQYVIPMRPLPEEVEISDRLTEDEIPKVVVKEIALKVPKGEPAGPAFHEKSAKNKKVNYVVSRKDRMMAKYGKPKTRGQKKK
jgi:ATP-dependent RNA helicase RhlE